jgi:predicted transcriptional regulator of viral defense system
MSYNYDMDTRENTRAVSEIAESQMGLLTSAQAERFGVSRNVLAYMAKSGKIERLEHGVYRVSGTPYDSNQGIYAVWLGTSPKQMAHERRTGYDGIVVGGRSAATIHGMGDFFLSPYHIYTPVRINSKRPGIVFTKRHVDPSDVIYTDGGLPITSATRTIFDLMCDSEDPSHVASALEGAVRNGMVDEDRLMALAKTRRGLPYSQDEIEVLMRSARRR